MPKINEITVTHAQLVGVSDRIHKLLNTSLSQGSIEWALFRALSDELGVDLFELMPDEEAEEVEPVLQKIDGEPDSRFEWFVKKIQPHWPVMSAKSTED